MSSVAAKRLLKEYQQLVNEAPDGITAGPVTEDNLFEWECLIQGPDDTPFEGGVFPATLSFPKVCQHISPLSFLPSPLLPLPPFPSHLPFPSLVPLLGFQLNQTEPKHKKKKKKKRKRQVHN